jgi:hypothetical protein
MMMHYTLFQERMKILDDYHAYIVLFLFFASRRHVL